ncbi:late embryogenesis abundant protein D-34-like [Salvia miltiorrhiza]|uniref:late embryogenesis abundant protein D-34-like n=1 Tax=Salvia miltiorrhiza TaxID=226208 RepID=UPI0025ABF6E7|nr:late embryogenesis abundant protein D-34-like [Salvia miltiorrhiza]
MNQEKPAKAEAIKYGDVFNVSGDLAAKPITPKDAAAVELAENLVLGENPKSGMATVMKSAAELNERRGFVRHDDTTDVVRDGGTEIAETTVVGHRLVTESIGGQLLGRFAMDDKASRGSPV